MPRGLLTSDAGAWLSVNLTLCLVHIELVLAFQNVSAELFLLVLVCKTFVTLFAFIVIHRNLYYFSK